MGSLRYRNWSQGDPDATHRRDGWLEQHLYGVRIDRCSIRFSSGVASAASLVDATGCRICLEATGDATVVNRRCVLGCG